MPRLQQLFVSELTLDHNNIQMGVDSADWHHFGHVAGTTTATDNYYSGCGATCGNANPSIDNGGGTNTTDPAGTPWPTSGNGCVGHLCN